MRNYMDVSNILEEVIYKYIETENLARDYGTDSLITQVEIHTLQTIHDHEGLNLRDLSKLKHKTKGALSKIVQKLVTKGLIDKQQAKDSNTEISLYLTEKGKLAYAHHKKFHEENSNEVLHFLDSISDQSYNDLLDVLHQFNAFLDQRIENKNL